jgi:hypothetical protein
MEILIQKDVNTIGRTACIGVMTVENYTNIKKIVMDKKTYRLAMMKRLNLKECVKCNTITSKKELEESAKYMTYGNMEICNKCCEEIDHKQDSQQQDK